MSYKNYINSDEYPLLSEDFKRKNLMILIHVKCIAHEISLAFIGGHDVFYKTFNGDFKKIERHELIERNIEDVERYILEVRKHIKGNLYNVVQLYSNLPRDDNGYYDTLEEVKNRIIFKVIPKNAYRIIN